MSRICQFVGRVLLAPIFVVSGVEKIVDWTGNTEYMAAQGMQIIPVFLFGAILLEIGSGIALIIGFRTRTFALLLCLYLIPVTAIFHNFWALGGAAQQAQMIHFLKNLAIMGGLLALAGQAAVKPAAG